MPSFDFDLVNLLLWISITIVNLLILRLFLKDWWNTRKTIKQIDQLSTESFEEYVKLEYEKYEIEKKMKELIKKNV